MVTFSTFHINLLHLPRNLYIVFLIYAFKLWYCCKNLQPIDFNNNKNINIHFQYSLNSKHYNKLTNNVRTEEE